MRLVLGYDDVVAGWVGENLGGVFHPPYTTIGGTKDGETLCIGVVFSCYNGSNVDLTIYGPNGFTRGFISSVFHYAFIQLGANRITAVTRRSNKHVLRLLPKLKFKFEGISARYFGPNKPDDAIRFVLFREDARKWIDG